MMFDKKKRILGISRRLPFHQILYSINTFSMNYVKVKWANQSSSGKDDAHEVVRYKTAGHVKFGANIAHSFLVWCAFYKNRNL
jgi:hypothetical protein